MIDEKKKMTTHASSVGTDDGQSISKNSDSSITTSKKEINDEVVNPQESLEEMYRKIQRMSDPAYLHTVTLDELMDNVFEVKSAVIDESLRAIAAFLADRYGRKSSPYGRVSNWVIGNEINNQLWNYMGPMSLESYINEYQRAFRVFYTAIRSTSQSSRVFFSTDYNWMHEADGSLTYNAKDLLDAFNNQMIPGGSMDWGLAYHPYSIPLTEPEFWNDRETGLIKDDASSPVVNMLNLSVLTDYLQQAQFRTRSGEVRHVILSEQGFTSTSATRGTTEDLQAAAIAYAYYIADSNPYIDAFIMSRQVDALSEMAASQAFGLWHCDTSKTNDIVATMQKPSWLVYKNIDNKASTLETTEKYKALIGISKWSDVVPNFRWKSLEK